MLFTYNVPVSHFEVRVCKQSNFYNSYSMCTVCILAYNLNLVFEYARK